MELDSNLLIKKGLTDSQIIQLIGYSQSDPDLKKFTGDFERFKDKAGFDEFSKHILQYYSLVDEKDNLLGIIWFDNMELLKEDQLSEDDNYGITFAIRLYDGARGKGLSFEFAQTCFDDFKASEKYQNKDKKGIWLTVSPDNYPGIKTYENLGFKKVKFLEKWGKDLMIQEEKV